MRFSIGASLSSLPFSPRLVRLCAAVGLLSLGFYICIQAIAYIEQVGAGKGAAAFSFGPLAGDSWALAKPRTGCTTTGPL